MEPKKWGTQPKQDRSQRTQERVLAATERLMELRPFHEISVAEIAQEAKASVSSLYARFPDKEALLGAVYERHASSQRSRFDQLLAPERWRGATLSGILNESFPLIVEIYRARQGLIRAFLEQAAKDERFRETWAEMGAFILERVMVLVLERSAETNHPDLPRAVRIGLGTVFATLAHAIQMHQIDSPQMDEVNEELICMMLRHLGVTEVTVGGG